jgi:hypothetical protein
MVIAPTSGHVFQTIDDAEIVQGGDGAIHRSFLGAMRQLGAGPQAYLGDCVEGNEVDSHFHKIDQFQVMFGAPGAYYHRSPLPEVFLLYSDAYSVYGPFGAGPEAHLHVFTLRGTGTNFHGSMPRCRDELLYRGARQHRLDLGPLLAKGAPAPDEVEVHAIVEPEPDGLAAYLMRIGPHTESAAPTGELRTGRYTVVLAGDIQYDGREFGPNSLGWSCGDAADLVLRGGFDGAVILFLHLPFPDTSKAAALHNS